ncbi:mitochondrial glutamate carrier 1-like [Anastrepha obliqua]|uniref:mitochondrial glutamate carrier 1-like n=1 Tax=Anastrepha obliqua TaxID=95512 RepID=UPI00240A11CF|nr:mitochondrial glutamate carrier 1-like [Anastrepha obliqua]
MSQDFQLLPKIINGGVGSMVGVLCVFPLDFVKTRLQNQQIGPNGEKQYSSIVDCFRKSIRNEGILGMYRGISVILLLVTPEKAVKLAANDYFRFHLTKPDGTLPMPQQMLAGAGAGCFQVLVATPMEFIKIQLQDAGRVAKEGRVTERITATSIFLKMYRERGIFGLYRGIAPTAFRDILFSLVYFPLFAGLNAMGPRKANSADAVPWVSFMGGLISGCTSAFVVTPFDVVKTRLQAIKKRAGEQEFSGILDCFVKTMRKEGITALFKGGLCRVMVISPLYGIVQVIYYLGVGEAVCDALFQRGT